MSLEIGAHTLACLQRGGSTLSASGQLNSLIDAVFKAALTGDNSKSSAAAPSASSSAVVYKESYSALLTLLYESSRHDASSSDVQSILEESGWDSDATTKFTTLFTEKKDVLRNGNSTAASSITSTTPSPPLSTFSSCVSPSIVDVNWRIDDALRSDTLEQIRTPSYMLQLKVTNPASSTTSTPTTSSIPFSCNYQQLQDLLAKLKDAQKQIQQRVE